MRDPDAGDLLLVAADDASALDRLVARWVRPVYQFFERTREPSAAVEATAETLVQLRDSADAYDPKETFPVWIWRIAVSRLASGGVEPAPVPVSRLRDSAAARLALQRAALSALPREEAAAILLTRVARLPVADAARTLSVSEPEVRRFLVHGFERLRRLLDPLFESLFPPEPPAAGTA